ncbi:TRAPPC11 [Blepharisma stoltei]|uniref:Trafficking protein particle complex subunit 11 domain-containing protein n=1 Tax=Blepharisma stoltei TaxID=1481888 RepID=A0AAU9I6N1_9CILI|nr:unnamed protein product [Blepharisma stoltei]
MGDLPQSVRVPNIRPVVTIVGGSRIQELLSKLLISSTIEQRLESEFVDFNHEFKIRSENKSFERYTNKGILKLNWTTKCKKVIPSVLLIVFDWGGLSPDSPQLDSQDWKSKEATIARYVRRFKDQLRGRLVKIAVLAILSPNDDNPLEDKGSLIKKACEIDSKGIFLARISLDENDSRMIKFKKYLWESSSAHYKDEIERLKKLKSRAQKEISGNFIELQIRYNFKLGYLCELKQDKEAALNHYKKAYFELQEMGTNDISHAEEIRTVADWTAHRILSILLSPPQLISRLKEAITVFKNHLVQYKINKHKDIMSFEQWKWLSEQYGRFGTLIDNIPQEILEKDNFWTHPAFYFQTSAIYFLNRSHITVEDPEFMQSVINWKGFIENTGLRVKDPEYVGQAKTLISHPNQNEMIEGISLTDQMNIIKTLEEAEVDHISIATDYFTRALKFYKIIIMMPRMAAHISYWLSELYMRTGQGDISYKVKVELWKKLDGWTTLLASLIKGLLSSSTENTEENLQWLLHCASVDSSKSAESFQEIKKILSAQMLQVRMKCPENLISLEACFKPKKISTYHPTFLEIKLVSSFPEILEPVKISLIFSDSSFNRDIEETISLIPGQPRLVSHRILVKSGLVSVIELIKVVLTYEPVAMSMIALEVDTLAKLYVNPPPAKLLPTFQHSPPALISEYYPLTITLNPEAEITNGKLIIVEETIDDEQEKSIRRPSIDRETENSFSVVVAKDEPEDYTPGGIILPNLTEKYVLPLKFLFSEEKTYDLKVKLRYSVKAEDDLQYKSEEVYDLDVPVFTPYQFSIRPGGPKSYCRIPLPNKEVKESPVDLKVIVPSIFSVQQLFEMKIIIKNKTNDDMEIKLSLEQVSAFMIGGIESLKFVLAAQAEETFNINIFGIEAGTLQLPSVVIKGAEFEKKWEGRILILP